MGCLGTLMRRCALALWALCAVLVLAAPVYAQEAVEVRPGLLWNRTGLPAVFPLQVKTAPGKDYYVLLEDAETGAPALAAYIEGGSFFRVLVPPGAFRVRFASGDVWRGEALLFGPGSKTRFIEVSELLEFGVKGLDRKTGHQIDLRELAPGAEASRVGPADICQSVRVVYGPVVAGGDVGVSLAPLNRAWQPPERPLIPRLDEETVTERLARAQRVGDAIERERDRARDRARRDAGRAVRVARYEVRLRPCVALK